MSLNEINAKNDNDIDTINTNEILNVIIGIETKAFEYKRIKEEKKEKEILIGKYKDMIKFLFENQLKDVKEFFTLIPGGVFMQMERKQSVLFTQKKIAQLNRNVSELAKKLNDKKKDIIKSLTSMNEAHYIDDDIIEDFYEDLKKKFDNKSKQSENSDEDDDYI